MKYSFTYNPERVGENGLDKMRFELGDVMVEGGRETAALSDEEYSAIIGSYQSWKRAKLMCIESIWRRFSYEVDTTVGPLKLELQERANHWKKAYDDLKKEVPEDVLPTMGPPSLETLGDGGHYFYGGMHDNLAGGAAGGDRDLLLKTGQPPQGLLRGGPT